MEKLNQEEIERKNKVKSILRDIHLGKEKKIISGLKALKVHGNDQVILPIMEVWNNGVSEKAAQAIIEFIGDIKSSSSTEIIMDVLNDEKFENIHLQLLTTVWNSKVDYSEYLSDFVNFAVNASDIMITLECLTIIENLTGPFEENQVMDAQLILRDYAENQKKNQKDVEGKIKLVSAIAQHIAEIDQNLSA